ncbi:MAG: DegV family protein [Chloroflexi bacterium]|nr:DegV family protein [Chloroflexota bacterium]
MPPVRIVTDSACDLPPEESARLGITVVPLVVVFGTDQHADLSLTPEEFWAKAAQAHPQTSQPSPGSFEKAFRSLVEAGHDVLCITITGKHSGTYNSARTAAAAFPEQRVAVWDSLSLSWGQGFQVRKAAQMAHAGASISDILQRLPDIQQRVRVFILLDTMDFIERGGRAAALMPVVKRVAKAFRIKPILTMVEGELSLCSAVRSTAKGVQKLLAEATALPVEMASVLHVRNAQEAQHLAQALAEVAGLPLAEVGIAETGAALSTHGGPGVVAFAALTRAA